MNSDRTTINTDSKRRTFVRVASLLIVSGLSGCVDRPGHVGGVLEGIRYPNKNVPESIPINNPGESVNNAEIETLQESLREERINDYQILNLMEKEYSRVSSALENLSGHERNSGEEYPSGYYIEYEKDIIRFAIVPYCSENPLIETVDQRHPTDGCISK